MIAVCVALAGAQAASADCTEAWIGHSDGPIATGTAALHDTTVALVLDPPWEGAFGEGEVRYRLEERRFSSRVHANAVMFAEGRAHEPLWIEGLPPGTPVAFEVHAEVVVEQWFDVGCGGSGCTPTSYFWVGTDLPGEFVEGGLSSFPPGIFETRTFTLALSRSAGEPFTLDYRWWAAIAHDDAHARVELSIAFAGLPTGARVVSCLDRSPVPAARASWGAVKSLYR